MHSAKGFEFDHVMILDDGTLADTPGERRLLHVALSRARRSLQIFSSHDPSPAFAALRHPALEIREEALIAVVRELADAPSRAAECAQTLEVDEWFTAVWEARWRA